jgi:hypothetical protein
MTRFRSALGVIAVLVTLAGCAATPAGPGEPVLIVTENPAAPGEVRGQGTVLQVGDAAPEFCLGAVLDSYPPQCSGPELVGWDWTTVDGQEVAGDVTFGTYAVSGRWDGTRLTVTGAIQLALYDPIPFVDPLTDPENAGDSSDADLLAVQTKLTADSPRPILTSYPQNGYLFAYVVYDDGTLQTWADQQYLPDVVAIRSALVDID